MENLIPLFGIVFAVGLPISIPLVFIVLSFRKRIRLVELHHAERMAAIERGMDIPPLPVELLDGHSRNRRPRSSLLPGLIWLFVGIGAVVATRPLAEEAALFGLIPTGVGLAYLVYYLIEGRKIEGRLLESELSKASEAVAERATDRQIGSARPL